MHKALKVVQPNLQLQESETWCYRDAITGGTAVTETCKLIMQRTGEISFVCKYKVQLLLNTEEEQALLPRAVQNRPIIITTHEC